MQRSRFGDWECDLIIGGKKSGYILTLVERQSLLLYGYLIRDKKASTVSKVLRRHFTSLPKEYVYTVTFDRGREFYCFEDIQGIHGLRCYFCHPYNAYEKGLIENSNGILRQFFPKRSSFSDLEQKDVDRAIELINTRPRKKHSYRTTLEQLELMGIILK